MSVTIIENNAGSIKAAAYNKGIEHGGVGEVFVEAEVEKGDPGEKMRYGVHGMKSWGSPPNPSTCEITRVYVVVSESYGEQNLDMTRLHNDISAWESEIVEELGKC